MLSNDDIKVESEMEEFYEEVNTSNELNVIPCHNENFDIQENIVTAIDGFDDEDNRNYSQELPGLLQDQFVLINIQNINKYTCFRKRM